MTDDLTKNLRTVGEVLDRRGADTMGDTPDDGDHTPVYPLPSLPPAARRRPPAWIGAAAAAVLLLAGVLALANWNRRDTVGVASTPSIAALVPGDLEQWDTVEVVDTQVPVVDHFLTEIDMASFLPSDAGDSRERAVVVTYLPFSGQQYGRQDDTDLVSGAGLRGSLYQMPERQQLFVLDLQVDGDEVGLSLTSGDAVTVDELFELAAAIEIGQPLAQQAVPGWELKGTWDSQRGAEPREVYASRTIPATYDNHWFAVTTLTNVTDDAMWTMGEPFRSEDVRLRDGRSAWVVVDEFGATAVWFEAPGVVVRAMIGTSNPDDVDLRAELLAGVEGLVPVDLAGWQAFAAEHRVNDNSTGMTTTTFEGTGLDQFEYPRRDGAAFEFGSVLENGDHYQLWVVEDTGQMCWALFGASYGEGCDDDPANWLDGERSTEPRMVVDARGIPILAYGFMPEGATWTDSEFHFSGRAIGTGSAGDGRVWGVPIPEGALTGTIRFMDDAGQELGSHELELSDQLG